VRIVIGKYPQNGIFHFVISRCWLLLPSIMILNRQHQGLFWAAPTRWATELQGGERQWSLSIKLHCNKINNSCFLVKPQKKLVMSGPYWRVCTAIIHTNVFFGESRYEVESRNKNKRRAKRGKQVWCKQLCFNPILVAERVAFAEYINPRGQAEEAYLSRPFG